MACEITAPTIRLKIHSRAECSHLGDPQQSEAQACTCALTVSCAAAALLPAVRVLHGREWGSAALSVRLLHVFYNGMLLIDSGPSGCVLLVLAPCMVLLA